MARCDRGVQTLLATAGAFAAFSLMTVAIGTDYWLYSRAYICNATNASADDPAPQPRTKRGDLTHSGLWRICCIEGINPGSCYRINHFPDDNDYDTDSSEYLLRIVRASSVFPLMSSGLLMMGGLCVGAGRVYSKRNNILLSAGILFVAAGLSNIIGIIVYISSNAGDPGDKRDDDRRYTYSYGWSFYFGALSFVVSEAVAVLAVNIYIEKNKEARCRARRRRHLLRSLSASSPYARMPGGGGGGGASFRYRRRASTRSSSHSTEASRSRENSPGAAGRKAAVVGGGGGGLAALSPNRLPAAPPLLSLGELSMYTLARDGGYSPEHDADFLPRHNCFPNDLKDAANRRTTPV